MAHLKKQILTLAIAILVMILGLIQLTEPAYAIRTCNETNCATCDPHPCVWDYCGTGNMEMTTCAAWCNRPPCD